MAIRKVRIRLVAHAFLGLILFCGIGGAGWLINWSPIYGFLVTISFLGGWFLGLNWLGPDLINPNSRMSDRWRNFEIYDGYCIDIGGAWEIYRATLWLLPQLNWPIIDGLLKIACLTLYLSFLSLPWALFLVAPFGIFATWLIFHHPLQCVLFFLGMELSNCMERILDGVEASSSTRNEASLVSQIELVRRALAIARSEVVDGHCRSCGAHSEEMKASPFEISLHEPDCKVIALCRASFYLYCEVREKL